MGSSPDPIVEQLRKIRIEKGWSQWEIAHRVGCSSTTVNHWERGRRTPLGDHLRRWADALGFDLVLQPKTLPVCGWRGFAGSTGCIRTKGHEGGHGFSDGSGFQPKSAPKEDG